MKKTLALLLVALMLCSIGFADEILFRGIPWGSSVDVVESEIWNNCGGYGSTIEGMTLPFYSEDFLDLFADYTDYESGWSTHTYTDELVVAGYPVDYVEAFSHYGLINGTVSREKSDGHFYCGTYSFNVMDIDAAYDDLKEKLNGLYGVGAETVETGSGAIYSDDGKQEYDEVIRYIKWTGDNNTVVILGCQTSSLGREIDPWNNQLSIRYSKSDADIALKQVSAAVKAEMLEKESESRDGNAFNMDGL